MFRQGKKSRGWICQAQGAGPQEACTIDGPTLLLPLGKGVQRYGSLVVGHLPRAAASAEEHGLDRVRFILPGVDVSAGHPAWDHLRALGGLEPLVLTQLRPGTRLREFSICTARTSAVDPRAMIEPDALSGAACLERLRTRTVTNLKLDLRRAGKNAVILRRKGRRRLLDEDHDWLVREVKSRGFRTIVGDATDWSFVERLRIFSQATLLIGVSGAGLSNIVWQGAGAAAIRIASWKIRASLYRNLAAMCGVHFLETMSVGPPPLESWPSDLGPKRRAQIEKLRSEVDKDPLWLAKTDLDHIPGARWLLFNTPKVLDRDEVSVLLDQACALVGDRDTVGRSGRYRRKPRYNLPNTFVFKS